MNLLHKKCNLFLNRGTRGFIFTLAKKGDVLYRVFSTPSNGKWKFEMASQATRGTVFPSRTYTLILGSPKWDVSVSRTHFYWHLNAVHDE